MIELVFVPGGVFKMGANNGQSMESSQPAHEVKISDFYISRHQVTQNEWNKIFLNGSLIKSKSISINGELPVEMVSWIESLKFCNQKSIIDGLDPCYSIGEDAIGCDFLKNGFRLPTEAEWEYAARGGAFGKQTRYSGSDAIDEVAWYKNNSNGHTHPVGLKLPNELGLYDMSGNVWEWCWDFYAPYKNGSLTNPRGPEEGNTRVYRGGSWVDFDYACGISVRGARPQFRRYNDIGFRIARTRIR